jgi:hypothetical protein
MKPVLLVLLVLMCGSALFGRQIRHSSKQTRHSRRHIHHVRRKTSKPFGVPTTLPEQTFSDTRRLALLQYFQGCACPAARWADTFVREADRQGLDWRLVASISMVESTGGKRYKNHNILGWKSAAAQFRSEAAGIEYVSSRLGHSPLYNGKTVAQMLRTYNSARRNYVALVTGVMHQLASIESNLRMQQASFISSSLLSLQPKRPRVMEPIFSN